MKTIKLFGIITISVLVMLMAYACEPEALAPVSEKSAEGHMKFRAVWEGMPGTKTAVQDDGVSVWWTTNESINVFYQGKTGKFTSLNTEGAPTVVFDGILDTNTGVGDAQSTECWAIYPYSENNSFDGTDVTITVPYEQTATTGSFADNLFPAIARSNTSDLTFYNVCGGVCFTVMASGVNSIVLKSINGESLTGRIRVGFDENGLPIIKELINGRDELTISGKFEPGKRYYAVLLPKVLRGGLSVTVKHSFSPSTTFKIEKSISVNRSRFGQLYNVDCRTIEGVISALKDLQKSLVAQYLSRQNIGGYPSLQIAMDCLGEDLVFPAAGNGWWTNTGEVKWTDNHNPDAYLTYYPWYLCYLWIDYANRILACVEDLNGSDDQKKMIKGQALIHRANSYFWLAQLYGDRYVKGGANSRLCVPIVTNPSEPNQPLSSLSDVYAQIVSDLETAIPLLNDKSNSYLNYSSKTDITGATAAGVRARVALLMQDWDAAKRYADMAISNTSAKLMSQEQYCDGFNDASNPEWMWGFEMSADQTLYFYGYMAYMSWNFNSSNIRRCPKCINSNLYDMIPATDIRKTLWDPTGKAWTMPTNSYTRFPYMNRKFAVKDYTSSVADANYMRLGEMYLIAAEAAAKIGDDAAAQQYLYDLNKTRDSGYTKSTKTGADLLEEIYTYRRIELWGEGHRFLDLKRLNHDLDRTGANHVESVSQTMIVPADDIRWKLVIPQKAIDNNSLIPANIND